MSSHHESENIHINRSRSNSFEATAARRMEQGQNVDLTRTSSVVSETIAEGDEDDGDEYVLGAKDTVDLKKPMATKTSTTSSTPYYVRARLLAEKLKGNAKAMGEAAEMLESFADLLEMGAKERRKDKGKADSKAGDSKGNEKLVGGTDRVWY